MPKVQRYVSNAPQREVPEVRIPAAQAVPVGAGMRDFGAALGQLSDVLLDQARRERDLEDEAQVRQVMNQEREAALSYKMGVEQGKLGQAGLQVFDETGAYFQDRRGQASGQLANERQRALFDASFSQLQNAYGSWAADWQTQQLKTFQKSTLLAESQQITDAAQRDQAPAAVELFAHGDATPWAGLDAMAGKLSQNVRRMYADDGHSPEVLDSLVKDETTKFHQRVLADMLMASPKAARAYLAAHGGEISGEVQTRIKDALQSATADQEAYDAASRIMQEHGRGADFATYTAAVKKAAQGDAGAERKIMGWVESFYSAHKKEREEARHNAVLLVDENVQKLTAARDLDGLKKYRARVEQIGDLGTRTSARRIVDQALSGRDVATDPEAYAEAMNEIGSARAFNVKAFQSKYLLKIGREDLKDLARMGEDAAGARVARKLAEVDASLKDLGIDKAEDRTLFNRTLKSFVGEYRAKNGQNPGDEEIQEEADRQAVNRVYDADFLFDDTVRQFKMHSVEIGDIPKKDAAFLRGEAERRGISLTDEQLKSIYADGRYLRTDEYKDFSGAK
jgi:hypothetical protein